MDDCEGVWRISNNQGRPHNLYLYNKKPKSKIERNIKKEKLKEKKKKEEEEEERENPFFGGNLKSLFSPLFSLSCVCYLSHFCFSLSLPSCFSFPSSSVLLFLSPTPLLPLRQAFSIIGCISNSDELLLPSPFAYSSIFIFFPCFLLLNHHYHQSSPPSRTITSILIFFSSQNQSMWMFQLLDILIHMARPIGVLYVLAYIFNAYVSLLILLIIHSLQ